MSNEMVMPFPSRSAPNMDLLSGFMKNILDCADEVGRRLLKVFKVMVIGDDGTDSVRKEDILDLAKQETIFELMRKQEKIDEELFRKVFYEKFKRILANLAMLEDIPIYKILSEHEQKVVDGIFDKLLKLAEAEG